MAGPQFVKYMAYVISALKDLGNSGTPAEVRDLIAEKLELSDDQLNESLNSGASRFENHVAWAKFYLAKAGYIDASSVTIVQSEPDPSKMAQNCNFGKAAS